jgi:hypothetical protein
MRHWIALLLVFVIIGFGCATGGHPYDLGEEAQSQQNFVAARRHYQEAVRSERDRIRREKAELRLANIQWRVFRETDDARRVLAHVASSGTERSKAWAERVRLEAQQQNFGAARDAARNAISSATTKSDRIRGSIAFAGVVAGEAVRALFERHVWPSNHEELRATAIDLQRIIRENGPLLSPASLLLITGLFADDGAAASEGWNAYKHLPPSAPRGVLQQWQGPRASAEDREKLIVALAGDRFYSEAAAIALDPRARDWDIESRPAVRDIVAYAKSIQRVRETTDEFYRNIAAGHEDAATYRVNLQKEAALLWNSLSWPKGKPEFDLNKVVEELSKRFGTVTALGKTGAHYNLHMGHRVVDQTYEVEQYGRKASVRFIVLDTMVSNGYGSWTGDGHSADGGWADATAIYQVRPPYADGAIRDWMRVSDPDTIAEDEREVREETARDAQRAQRYEIGPFPGMALRLRRQNLARLHDQVRQREAFIARDEAEEFQSSILLHEGRHAIDAVNKFNGSTADREYRAKLSEVALADAPRDALGVIFRGAVGGKSPHGEANERLARGITAWMQAHSAEIPDLKAGNLMTQIDLLTDDQIRAAVRSLDPFSQP